MGQCCSNGLAKTATNNAVDRPSRPKMTFKVCVCGGAGGIGQPLSMLMALDERVSELSVFDLDISMVPAAGVAADLSHLEYESDVKSYSIGKDDKPIEKLEE